MRIQLLLTMVLCEQSYYISCLFQSHRNTILCLFLQEKFAGVDIRVRVSGGGHVAQIYAIRQAISKALVAFYQKCKHCIKLNLARPI